MTPRTRSATRKPGRVDQVQRVVMALGGVATRASIFGHGVSAARHYGLCALDDGRIHVAVPANASRLRLPTVVEALASLRQLRAAVRRLPARYSRAVELSDGTSQSGPETLVRLRLRRLGIGVRTQVQIGAIGRVDLLVGSRLVIECDSHEFHEGGGAERRDYDRDVALVDMDYLVLRLNYRQIVHEWDRIEPVIRGLVARHRHLRPRPQRDLAVQA